jgi:L-threonylcarbamoyladenylate synthase
MIKLKVDPDNPDMKAIRAAADAIRRGELVIFPTETVYGLAADALNVSAVKKVFEAKGRFDRQPLPVQVASLALSGMNSATRCRI